MRPSSTRMVIRSSPSTTSKAAYLTATRRSARTSLNCSLQELSNFVVTKTGVNGSPTLIKRAVNTKLGLMLVVVVLAGLG